MRNQTNRLFLYLSVLLIGSAFVLDSPEAIFSGIIQIIVQSDILITDYFAIGGVGAALFNAGLITLVSVLIIMYSETEFSGSVIASIMLMLSFGLFGKNIVNIIPILIGTYLYALVTKEPYKDIVHISLLATSFSPIVSELMFVVNLPLYLRLFLSITVGLSIGFTIKPVARSLYKVHDGYSLANIGFAIGIMSTLYVSVMKSYGYVPYKRMIVTTQYTVPSAIVLSILFLLLFYIGWLSDHDAFKKYRQLLHETGHGDNDFYKKYGLGAVLINMSVNGFLALFFVLVVAKGALNGPNIGGILTIIGFSGAGKHWKNITPIFIGIYLGGLTKSWSLDQPAVLLGALFSTALAPIAGDFGFIWGVVAGFINSSVVLNSGSLHAGMNLYNTGFAVGIVAAVMVPVLRLFIPLKEQRSK